MARKLTVDRRKFLKGAAGGVAGLVASTTAIRAKEPTPVQSASAPLMPKEVDPSNVDVLTTDRSGSDFMVDVLKSLGFEYIASNPGSSFRGLHESVINYGGNQAPEFITCCHEESAIGMAHGYAKIEGKPMCVFVHSNVGLQHGSMAIFNAYCDRVPVYLIAGNTIDATVRRPGVEWDHSAQDLAAMVRDFLKWDDLPISLPHFAESAVRAYKIAMTTPTMPVLLVADSELQEGPIAPDAKFHIPKLALATPPQGESGSVAEAARLLVAAENPVIIADRAARTPAGMMHLIGLAEALQAPVIDQEGRLNFPTRHPLNHTQRSRALMADADVILGLELTDFWGTVHSMRDQLHRTSKPTTRDGAKLISISATDLDVKGNHQDIQRYPEVDLAIAGDAETTLPSLLEAVKRSITNDRKRTLQDRGSKLADAYQKALVQTRSQATYGWDTSPITIPRLSAEMWAQIKNEDWSLVSDVGHASRWPLRMWSFDKHYQFIGGSGGAGVGYGAPASAGAALANKKHGRLSVSIQTDGDLMYAPGILWTMAHHHIPLLSVMHNNRAYHQEVMHIQRMANRHNRGITRAGIGTTIQDPNIDFARVAQGMGVYAQGPITDPKDLGPALRRAIEVVKRGEPALIDAVTEPR
ncbi:MAG: twin-arginine translocation signal domain-containing protein [Acidobacteriia bacterium]|nr:twin-arginine translocation signal domain-containing protein [Terriglobia bacterium]